MQSHSEWSVTKNYELLLYYVISSMCDQDQ